MLKIVTISFSLNKGGAGLAANNFRHLLVNNKSSSKGDSITQDDAGKYQFFKRLISLALSKLQLDGNPIKHSLNLFSYQPILNSFRCTKDILYHIHWMNNDTLSVFDFDKIPPGTIITLHDEWLYCGSEHHYIVSDNSNKFISGYQFFKSGVFGINWNYFIWKVKYRKLAHRDDLIYTVPSSWMLERAKSSAILNKSNILLLPNPINTEIFKPSAKDIVNTFRSSLNIDNNSFVIAFPTFLGKKNQLKGINLLNSALELLQSKTYKNFISKIILIDFGGSTGESIVHGFRKISIGQINDPSFLAKLYSAADCVVVPSMIESFGQVAAEALSCSTPVVCFDTSGLRDIVLQHYTGLVAESFSPTSLCEQLLDMINTSKKARLVMGKNGRKHVIENFSFPIITKKYLNILEDAAKLKKITG